MESVIFQQPLVLYAAAMLLHLVDRFYRKSRGIFTFFSTALVCLATAYSLVLGASMWECATVVLVFLVMNMGVRE